jgi:hypothetical protein
MWIKVFGPPDIARIAPGDLMGARGMRQVPHFVGKAIVFILNEIEAVRQFQTSSATAAREGNAIALISIDNACI